MSELIVPRRPGVFCALGLQLCDIRHTAQTPFQLPFTDVVGPDLDAVFRRMIDALDCALDVDQVARSDRAYDRAADVRYVGQFHELTLPLDQVDGAEPWDVARLATRFHEAHAQAYGFSDPSAPCEFVNLRAEAIGILDKPDAALRGGEGGGSRATAVGSREVYLQDGYCDCALYSRDALASGDCVRGPAVITQRDSTVLVLPGQLARVSDGDVLRIASTGEGAA
jgi:N-methylhydantoinase A